MISFYEQKNKVYFSYEGEDGRSSWVLHELRASEHVRISRVFHFEREDLISDINPSREESEKKIIFRFGRIENGYIVIPGRRFGIEQEVRLRSGEVPIARKTFVAERNINVLGRIADIYSQSERIVIGGNEVEAIPWQVYDELLRKFPNTGELNRYARMRVDRVVGEYFPHGGAERKKYDDYLNRKVPASDSMTPERAVLIEREKQIYVFEGHDDCMAERSRRVFGETVAKTYY